MKRGSVILLLALMSLFFPFTGFAYVIGDVNSDNRVDLTEAINALQVTGGVRTPLSASATINVPADIPTIQQAIDAAKSGDIINVAAGTYTGALTVANKALTIQGAGKASTIITSGSTSTTALTVDGARMIVVSGITLKDSYTGILAMRGAAVEVTNAIVQGANYRGILIIDNATAKLTDVTVQQNSGHGIHVTRSSSITLSGTVTSSYNTSRGIEISQSSSIHLSNAIVTVNNNGDRGINLINNSALLEEKSSLTVQDNGGSYGVYVLSGSSFLMQNNATLLSERNAIGIRAASAASLWTNDTSQITIRACGTGLSIKDGSNAQLSGTLTVENTTGTGSGVQMDRNSSLQMNNSLLISNDVVGNGVGISMTSGAQIAFTPFPQQTIVIQNNNTGIWASDGSIGGSGSVTIKNNVNDLNVNFGSKVSLPAGSYGTCTTDGTVLGITCP
ncbi:MAG: right-handed parallel beta-helix repeat-containing protein [Deltaproteobacteria bacterium]|nr:right-handed parallel beta-helix repeat-containing protein [Deltaproteobacteria bacterium]